MFVTSGNRCAQRYISTVSFVRAKKSVRCISLSNYRGTPSRCFAGTEWQSVLYRGIDIGAPALPCFGAASSLTRPSQSRQSRSRTGNRKRRNLTWHRVCTWSRSRSRVRVCVRARVVRARSRWHGRTAVPAGEKDIESDSRRTGHNFRPTRSELLMTSLPPPHHSRCRTYGRARWPVTSYLRARRFAAYREAAGSCRINPRRGRSRALHRRPPPQHGSVGIYVPDRRPFRELNVRVTLHSSILAFKLLRLYINETFHLSDETWRRRVRFVVYRSWGTILKNAISLSTTARLMIKSTRKFHRDFQGFSVTFDRSSTRNVIMAKCNYLARHDAFAPSLSSRSLRKYVYWRRGPISRMK